MGKTNLKNKYEQMNTDSLAQLDFSIASMKGGVNSFNTGGYLDGIEQIGDSTNTQFQSSASGQFAGAEGMSAGKGANIAGSVVDVGTQVYDNAQRFDRISNTNTDEREYAEDVDVGGDTLNMAGKGAAAGAAIGSAIPVVGTLIGGAVGAIGGAAYGFFNADKAKAEADKRNEFVDSAKESDKSENEFLYDNTPKGKGSLTGGTQVLETDSYAGGGEIGMPNSLSMDEPNIVGAGGTHESNPNGGVQQGIGSNGKPNVLEEDEVTFMFEGKKLVISNRI